MLTHMRHCRGLSLLENKALTAAGCARLHSNTTHDGSCTALQQVHTARDALFLQQAPRALNMVTLMVCMRKSSSRKRHQRPALGTRPTTKSAANR